jgi:hypothetical protein
MSHIRYWVFAGAMTALCYAPAARANQTWLSCNIDWRLGDAAHSGSETSRAFDSIYVIDAEEQRVFEYNDVRQSLTETARVNLT